MDGRLAGWRAGHLRSLVGGLAWVAVLRADWPAILRACWVAGGVIAGMVAGRVGRVAGWVVGCSTYWGGSLAGLLDGWLLDGWLPGLFIGFFCCWRAGSRAVGLLSW